MTKVENLINFENITKVENFSKGEIWKEKLKIRLNYLSKFKIKKISENLQRNLEIWNKLNIRKQVVHFKQIV